ncbi:unnamed protein product [Closterium sp. Naga37s-1]|nr:unnamed protein product [Closterium sp. Naga37s-1]
MEATASTYPPPPPYYKLYAAYDPHTRTGGPPPPPAVTGEYVSFGAPYNTEDRLPSLEEQGVRQLFPSSKNINTRAELKALGRELGLLVLELADVLVERPSQAGRCVEDISLLFTNLHFLLNSLRPHQARATLTHILKTQLEMRKQSLQGIKDAMLHGLLSLLLCAALHAIVTFIIVHPHPSLRAAPISPSSSSLTAPPAPSLCPTFLLLTRSAPPPMMQAASGSVGGAEVGGGQATRGGILHLSSLCPPPPPPYLYFVARPCSSFLCLACRQRAAVWEVLRLAVGEVEAATRGEAGGGGSSKGGADGVEVEGGGGGKQ